MKIADFRLQIGMIVSVCALSANLQSAIFNLQSKKQIPPFIHGEECLFCHRHDAGSTWQQNSHARTLRDRGGAPELEKRLAPRADAEYFLGSRNHVRLLKKAGYGKMAIWDERASTWDQDRFQTRCAGCHTTAYDSDAKTYAYTGLDCYTCHGAVPMEHAADLQPAFLGKRARGDARAVTMACAQCHLRGGKSRATGLLFPYNYTAPGDLFGDFQVNLALADDKTLNPGDRHVYRNVRDVMQKGAASVTCLTCHRIHGQSSVGHWRAYRTTTSAPICLDCHATEGKYTPGYVVRSAVCEY
jgi:hypothetical protein